MSLNWSFLLFSFAPEIVFLQIQLSNAELIQSSKLPWFAKLVGVSIPKCTPWTTFPSLSMCNIFELHVGSAKHYAKEMSIHLCRTVLQAAETPAIQGTQAEVCAHTLRCLLGTKCTEHRFTYCQQTHKSVNPPQLKHTFHPLLYVFD